MASVAVLTRIQTSDATQSRLHLDYLDGLRAVAALFVLLHHLPMPPNQGLVGLMTYWLYYGHLAVDAFIVISGFCLILPVAQTGELREGARGFFKRRAHRILPPFYAALALSVLLDLIMNHLDHPLERFHLTPKSLLINALFLQDYLPRYATNDAFWSIAVEWKIYFLFPVLLWLLKRAGKRRMLLASFVLAYGYAALLHKIWGHGILTRTCPWYLFLFTLGICAGKVAIEYRSRDISANTARNWAWLTAFSVFTAAIPLKTFPMAVPGNLNFLFPHFPIIDAFTGITVALFLFTLTLRDAPAIVRHLRNLLSWKPLVFLGTFSYSIYLIHQPIIEVIQDIITRAIPGNGLSFAQDCLRVALIASITLPLSLGSAYLFFLKCEKPFLNTVKSNTPR